MDDRKGCVMNVMIFFYFLIVMPLSAQDLNEEGRDFVEKECRVQKDSLKALMKRCRALKGKSGYKECTTKFKSRKATYNDSCSNRDQNGIDCGPISFAKYERDVCMKNGYKGSRCAMTLRNLAKLYSQSETQKFIQCENQYVLQVEDYIARQREETLEKMSPCAVDAIIRTPGNEWVEIWKQKLENKCMERAEKEDLIEIMEGPEEWGFCEWKVATYIEATKDSLVQNPNAEISPLGLLYIGYVHLKMGNKSWGVEVMQTLIETFPGSSEADRAKLYLASMSEQNKGDDQEVLKGMNTDFLTLKERKMRKRLLEGLGGK